MKKILFTLLVISCTFLFADLKVNDHLPFEHYQNQFDEDMIIDEKTKLVIVTFTKDNGAIINEFLEKNTEFLKEKNAHYLADVSAVPSFVMSMFMKPKFKSYKYQMGLIYDEEKALNIPKKEDMITLIHLDNKRIKNIEFVENLDTLK